MTPTGAEILCVLDEPKWYFVFGHVWYEIVQRNLIADYCSFFPLRVTRKHDLVSQGSAGGKAIVGHLSVDSVEVKLFDFDQEEGRNFTFRADSSICYSIEWRSGYHADRWVELLATLEVENVQALEMSIFLPHSDGDREKSVEVYVGLDALCTLRIPRDTLSKHQIRLPDLRKHVLTFESGEPENVDMDARSLGFMTIHCRPVSAQLGIHHE